MSVDIEVVATMASLRGAREAATRLTAAVSRVATVPQLEAVCKQLNSAGLATTSQVDRVAAQVADLERVIKAVTEFLGEVMEFLPRMADRRIVTKADGDPQAIYFSPTINVEAAKPAQIINRYAMPAIVLPEPVTEPVKRTTVERDQRGQVTGIVSRPES